MKQSIITGEVFIIVWVNLIPNKCCQQLYSALEPCGYHFQLWNCILVYTFLFPLPCTRSKWNLGFLIDSGLSKLTHKKRLSETIEELTPEMSASQSPYGGRWDLGELHRALQRRSPAEPNPSWGGGVLLISSHGDDRRIFLGLKSSILGFLG